MTNTDIVGGVSPLKARKSSGGGYAQSTGKRGAGGRNVGGYNVNTRFKARGEWQKPPSGGTTYISPKATKPYSYDKDGKLKVNTSRTGHYEDIYKDVTTTTGGLESYKKVWDKNENDLQGKYEGDYDKWVEAAEKWWEEEATEEQKASRKKTTKTEKVWDGRKWVWDTEGTEGTQTQSQTQSQN